MSLIQEFISDVNPLAKMQTSEHSKVEIDYFLEEVSISQNKSENDTTTIGDDIHTTESHVHHYENENIENIVIYTNIQSKEKIDKAIGNILWDLSEKYDFVIIRFKGILYINNEVYSLQGLYDLYEIEQIKTKNKSLEIEENKTSKILFIGKNLKKNKEILTTSLSE